MDIEKKIQKYTVLEKRTVKNREALPMDLILYFDAGGIKKDKSLLTHPHLKAFRVDVGMPVSRDEKRLMWEFEKISHYFSYQEIQKKGTEEDKKILGGLIDRLFGEVLKEYGIEIKATKTLVKLKSKKARVSLGYSRLAEIPFFLMSQMPPYTGLFMGALLIRFLLRTVRDYYGVYSFIRIGRHHSYPFGAWDYLVDVFVEKGLSPIELYIWRTLFKESNYFFKESVAQKVSRENVTFLFEKFKELTDEEIRREAFISVAVKGLLTDGLSDEEIEEIVKILYEVESEERIEAVEDILLSIKDEEVDVEKLVTLVAVLGEKENFFLFKRSIVDTIEFGYEKMGRVHIESTLARIPLYGKKVGTKLKRKYCIREKNHSKMVI